MERLDMATSVVREKTSDREAGFVSASRTALTHRCQAIPQGCLSHDVGFFISSRTPNDMKCCPAAWDKRAAPTRQRESDLTQVPTMNRSSTYEAVSPRYRTPGSRMSLESKALEGRSSAGGAYTEEKV
jgi:hypothetical protein